MKRFDSEPTLDDVHDARSRIQRLIYPVTPRISERLSRLLDRDVWLIPECLQRTGSFKFRGALNRMLIHAEADGGPVITASSGNHAIGVTVAARIAGVESSVFVPKGANEAKLAMLGELGANVIVEGTGFDETEDLMFEYAEKYGLQIINSFDPDVIAGHATAALEALGNIGQLSALVAPVASGGLLSGCALVARELVPDCQVIGVQTKAWPAMHHSVQAGRLVTVSGGDTVADGLAGNAMRSEMPFQMIKRLVSQIVLVDESSLVRGVRHGLVQEHLVLEGAGAAAIAAALDGKLGETGGPVGLVLSGGNCTETLLRRAICGCRHREVD